MEVRILRHIQDRQKGNWDTVEEPVDLVQQLHNAGRYDTVLIDCLTLWLNNLMFEASEKGIQLDEDRVSEKTKEMIESAKKHPGDVILVTNEVGLGIVPDNKLARVYRDLIGRCNQCVGFYADRVFLVTCGIPLQIKGKR